MQIGEDLYISDEINTEGNVEFGVYLPFGNYESGEITRDDALTIIKHLESIFSIKRGA